MVDNRDKLKSAMQGKLKPVAKPDNLFRDTANEPRKIQPQAKESPDTAFKMDVFTERVTLALSPEQRNFLDNLARDFQVKRTSKLETINRNTLVRGLVEVLKDVDFSPDEVVNNEAEMIALLKRKLRR
jgi:hypothetical protein